MEDGDIFENNIQYTKFTKKIQTDVIDIIKNCKHEYSIEEDGISICEECGIQTEIASYDPEWRMYSDSKSTKDPTRCHKIKSTVKTIDSVVESLQLPESIKMATEEKYRLVVGNKTSRGTGRKGIIAACLLYSYRDMNDYRTQDEVRQIFGLSKKDMSAGLTKYYEKFPQDRITHVKPENLIRRIMSQAEIDEKHFHSIKALTKYLDGTSSLLNRSNTQSVAAAIVYLYLCINPDYKKTSGLTKTVFAKRIKLSDITIIKLAKEACKVVMDEVEGETSEIKL